MTYESRITFIVDTVRDMRRLSTRAPDLSANIREMRRALFLRDYHRFALVEAQAIKILARYCDSLQEATR
jgi:hypothetical protein